MMPSSMGNHFRMLHFNVTLLNDKATTFLAELDDSLKPDAIGFLETHLRGPDLNRMRRVTRKIGWRIFSTPAILKAEQLAQAGEAPAPEVHCPQESPLKKHQNSGGEAILVDPSRKVSGYHQPAEAFGYRTVLVRMKGWTLHCIVAYFDSAWGFETGPNAVKWQSILGLITSLNVPWIIMCDCNRTPDEVAQSAFVRFLKAVVIAPNVDFTCASGTAEGGGRVIDMVISSKACAPHIQIRPFYKHPFKPHVVGLEVLLSLEPEVDIAKTQVVPDEIMQTFGPRNQGDTWESHFLAAEGCKAQIDAPWNAAANQTLTDLYARWSMATEAYYLSTMPMASDKQRGRGSNIQFEEVQASFANIDTQIYTKPHISYWEQLGTLLRIFRGMLRKGSASSQMDEVADSIGQMTEDMIKFIPHDQHEQADKLRGFVHSALHDKKLVDARMAVFATNDILAAALRKHSQETTLSYQKFVCEACQGGASAGHALVKCFERDAGRSYEDELTASHMEQGIDVASRMQTRMVQWAAGKWSCHRTSRLSQIESASQRLSKAHAEAEPLPKHSIRELRRVLAGWSAKAGLGIDLWVLKLWATLPDNALRMLLLIIQLIEGGAFPMQILLVLIALIPKPKGGERPIALTAMLYRLVIKLRRPIIGHWEDKEHGFWDAAIKGSSCLRAALARALRMEAAVAVGFIAIGGLWDIAAFFDSIQVDDLIEMALDRHFPPQLLLLGVNVHSAARAFREGPFCSNWVQPTGTSILAGCGCSVDFTRALLYNLMDKIHADYRPMQASTWVDDIAQVVTGTPATAVSLASLSGAALARALQQKGLTISAKSTFVATTKAHAIAVQQYLADAGFAVQVSAVGQDLGADFVAGGTRRVTMQGTRLRKVFSGVKHTLKLGQSTKGSATRKLILTGVRPRAYGFSVMGAAPTTVQRMRASIVQGLCIRKPGGCTTTALYTHGYADKDPLVAMTVDNIVGFVEAVKTEGALTPIMCKAWANIISSLPDAGKWSKVAGPMASAIATLTDLGWAPLEPTKWIDPQGREWQLDYAAPLLPDSLKEVLQHQISEYVWKNFAIKHYAGPSWLPDVTAYRGLAKFYKKGKDWRKLYWLEAVIQGGAHTMCEKHLHPGAEGQPICDHCSSVVIGCPFKHFAYYCPVTLKLELEGIKGSRHLVEVARVEIEDQPSKWLRGLIPLNVPDPLDHEYSFTATSTIIDVTGKLIGGDGSGGAHSKDFRTRRCGFGLVIIEPDACSLNGTSEQAIETIGQASGTVPGKQTVPRAEATAILHALRTTRGHATFVCDNLGVVRRYKHIDSKHCKGNGILWNQIALARQKRSSLGFGVLKVVWIPSHISFGAAISQGYEPSHWLVNQLADTLAGKAAAAAQLDYVQLERLQRATKEVATITKRLVDIMTYLAPSGDVASQGALALSEPRIFKLEQVNIWAKEARHALDENSRCVRCGLQINLSRNMVFLESILHMRCMGCKGSLPKVTLHTKPMEDSADSFTGRITQITASWPLLLASAHVCTTSLPFFATKLGKALHVEVYSMKEGATSSRMQLNTDKVALR